MLQERIQEAFKGVSGRFSTVDAFVGSDFGQLSEKELEDVKTILSLRKEIEDIKKRSAESFATEQESYKKFLEQRAKSERQKQLEQQIDKLHSEGDVAGARAIAQAQLDKIKRDAETAKRNFVIALQEAEKDKILTEEERRNLQKLKAQMQETLSDQDRWQGRIDRSIVSGAKDSKNATIVGGWSLSGLASRLGGSIAPEQETARNTKKSLDVLNDINRNIKNNQGMIYG